MRFTNVTFRFTNIAFLRQRTEVIKAAMLDATAAEYAGDDEREEVA